MKIINRTKWNTKDLKSLSNLVIKKVGSETRLIYILPSRNFHGKGRLFGNIVWIYVPTRMNVLGSDGRNTQNEFDVKIFSQILEHEAEHNLGLNHKEMGNCYQKNVDYTLGFIVRPKEIKEKPKRNLKEERYKKALMKRKEIESKLKRYKISLKNGKRR